MTAILLALIAAAGFFGASLLASTGLGRSARLQQVSMVVAAGILLGVTFADLIPEALEGASSVHVAFAMAAGFLVLYVVESTSGAHTHHHEPHAHAHSHGHSHAPAGQSGPGDCVPMHAVTPFLIGLGLHNFTDGIIIGVGDDASGTAMSAIALGILVHQLPVGLSFAAVLTAANRRGAALLRPTLLVAAMIPLGTLAFLLLPDLSASATDTLLAVAAGALLYVSTGHLLPEAHSEERHFAVVLTFVGALLATIAFIAVA